MQIHPLDSVGGKRYTPCGLCAHRIGGRLCTGGERPSTRAHLGSWMPTVGHAREALACIKSRETASASIPLWVSSFN